MFTLHSWLSRPWLDRQLPGLPVSGGGGGGPLRVLSPLLSEESTNQWPVSTNQRPVSTNQKQTLRLSGLYWPIRGQYYSPEAELLADVLSSAAESGLQRLQQRVQLHGEQLTNQGPVFRSRDLCPPITGQYSGHVTSSTRCGLTSLWPGGDDKS